MVPPVLEHADSVDAVVGHAVSDLELIKLVKLEVHFYLLNLFIYVFIYLFIYLCVWSRKLCSSFGSNSDKNPFFELL